MKKIAIVLLLLPVLSCFSQDKTRFVAESSFYEVGHTNSEVSDGYKRVKTKIVIDFLESYLDVDQPQNELHTRYKIIDFGTVYVKGQSLTKIIIDGNDFEYVMCDQDHGKLWFMPYETGSKRYIVFNY